MFDREPAVYSSTSESHSHPSGRESSRLNAATSGERVATQPINRGSPTTPVHDTHVHSYPDDVQVMGPDIDWNRIVAEAMQVLRENPSMFDIAEAYDYTAMNQDDTTSNDMTDMKGRFEKMSLIPRWMVMSRASKKFLKMVISLFCYLGIGSTQVIVEVSVTKPMMMKALIAESPNWCLISQPSPKLNSTNGMHQREDQRHA